MNKTYRVKVIMTSGRVYSIVANDGENLVRFSNVCDNLPNSTHVKIGDHTLNPVNIESVIFIKTTKTRLIEFIDFMKGVE